MKILLIEDTAGFADPMRQQLEARGHQVTWIIGAKTLGADRLTGILAGKDATPLEDKWDDDSSRLIEVVFSDFELALVDGGLIGPVDSGEPIVKALTKAGLPAIAITGGGTGNPVLIAAGALAGLPKEFVVLAIKGDVLVPADIVKDQDKERLSSQFKCFVQEMKVKAGEARKSGGKFEFGYPAFD
ncbi:MAG: hypothetical protein C0507_07265 [Cyanobacteria bacterium PR.3.49]|jgi:hypothetical protein|nr:hypothetical protein [Cyanobacteria bacterium PR.3.49]